MRALIVLVAVVVGVRADGGGAAVVGSGPGHGGHGGGGSGHGGHGGGYEPAVYTHVKKEPYLVEQRVPYTVVKRVPVYKPVYNTVYRKVPQPYEVIKHVTVVKHVPVIKHVPVVKHHTVFKPVPVIKHHTHVQRIPVRVPVYVYDKPSYGEYGHDEEYGYGSH